jgi:putative hydrolase of the HAD superfamily
MSEIKNIVFDLGNVLLDLNLDKTETAFRDLLQEEFETAYLKYESDRLFERFEVGRISPFEFVNGMRSAANVPITDDDVIDGWNALLGEMPKSRIDFLKDVAQHYNIYLLSNTNAIHMMWLDEYLEDNHQMKMQDFINLFKKHYFSFQIQLRKPDAKIYEYIIKDSGINPAETLFVDDRKDNIKAAKAFGFQTYLHDPRMNIASVLEQELKQ